MEPQRRPRLPWREGNEGSHIRRQCGCGRCHWAAGTTPMFLSQSPRPRSRSTTPVQLDDPAGSPGLTRAEGPEPGTQPAAAGTPPPGPLPGAAGALSPGVSLAQWQPRGSARPLPRALCGPWLLMRALSRALQAPPALNPGTQWLVDAEARPGPSGCFHICHLRWAGLPTICCPALVLSGVLGGGWGVTYWPGTAQG